MRRRVCAPRPGTTAVEFALAAPLLFLFVLGFIETSRGLMVTHLLSNAARHGCRTGIIDGRSTDDIRAAVSGVLSAQGVRGETTTVQVNGADADAATAREGDELTVLVTIPAGNVTWVPGGGYLTGSLSGRYTLRRE